MKKLCAVMAAVIVLLSFSDGFRPVWELEFRAGRDEYDVHVDAVTGQVLKFELDD